MPPRGVVPAVVVVVVVVSLLMTCGWAATIGVVARVVVVVWLMVVGDVGLFIKEFVVIIP